MAIAATYKANSVSNQILRQHFRLSSNNKECILPILLQVDRYVDEFLNQIKSTYQTSLNPSYTETKENSTTNLEHRKIVEIPRSSKRVGAASKLNKGILEPLPLESIDLQKLPDKGVISPRVEEMLTIGNQIESLFQEENLLKEMHLLLNELRNNKQRLLDAYSEVFSHGNGNEEEIKEKVANLVLYYNKTAEVLNKIVKHYTENSFHKANKQNEALKEPLKTDFNQGSPSQEITRENQEMIAKKREEQSRGMAYKLQESLEKEGKSRKEQQERSISNAASNESKETVFEEVLDQKKRDNTLDLKLLDQKKI